MPDNSDPNPPIFTTKSPVKKFLLTAFLLVFAAYLFIYFLLGGDAIQGQAVGGHFYLAAHGDATRREVSPALYYTDLWLIRAGVFIFFAALALAVFERVAGARRRP